MFFSKFLKYSGSLKFGQISFFLGIFLLASAPFFAAIFLFVSLLISFLNNKKIVVPKKLTVILILTTFFLILSTVYQFYNFSENYLPGWDPKLSIFGLANWLPYFPCFILFQNYLNSEKSRIKSAFLFVAGSLPVIVSGFAQRFFGFYGPYEYLNGLIIWYQKQYPNEKVLSGLFSNPNYTSSWLLVIFPFCIAFFIENKSIKSKIISIIFLILVISSILLTKSRSGLVGVIFSTLFVFSNFLLTLAVMLLIIFTFLLLTYLKINFQNPFFDSIYSSIPKFITDNFSTLSLSNLDLFPRYAIWKNSILFIKDNPIFGYGASTFKEIYKSKVVDLGYHHSHNIFFDLSIGYGIIPSILMIIFFTYIIIKASKKLYKKQLIYKNQRVFEKSWLVSLVWLLFSQLVDIQYYDFRISCSLWILVSGLMCFIDEKSLKMHK